MSPLQNCIVNKDISYRPIWFMRQAGRYLPEFRKIRKKNQNFINLCLNKKLVPEITLQPLKRFDLDAAIIFSDILMVPYGLGQKVSFTRGLGPKLGYFDDKILSKVTKKKFKKRLTPIYQSIENTSKKTILKNKDLIGFIGAPWTLLVYIINRCSPKKNLKKNFFSQNTSIEKIMILLVEYLKLHVLYQIKNGATTIQIFDSWAGLLNDKDLENYIYYPTKQIVDFAKSLNTPVICFPRNIKKYKEYVQFVKPSAINIDYNVNPKKIANEIDIPIQGGLDPKILLQDKEEIKKKARQYLQVFKNHPYIFNLGHGVLPETDPNMVDYLIKFVKDY